MTKYKSNKAGMFLCLGVKEKQSKKEIDKSLQIKDTFSFLEREREGFFSVFVKHRLRKLII